MAAICAPWFNILTDNADSAGMQAHLHAMFETRELIYDDEYAALRMSGLFAFVTERGVVSNHWPAGASFLQAPGWLLGRLAGVLLGGGAGAEQGISERAATWTVPLLGLRCWALLVLAWLSARVHRWLRAMIDRRAATLTIAALVLGTPLLYYAAESPLRPHLWGAAVVAVLTMRWFDAIERAAADPERAAASWRPPVELAVYAGLATAVRPQLAILAALVAHERWVASAELSLIERLKLLARHGVLSAAAFLVWPLLVVRMQVWMYGGVADYAGEVSHHLREFMLSTHHGALLWCPVLLLGLLGVAIGVAGRQRGALLLLGLLAAQIWLDAGTREIEPFRVLGTRTWTGGTAFGPRKLLDVVPLMLPGVVWLWRWLDSQTPLDRRRWQRRLSAATLLALVPTILLLAAAFVDPALCSTIIDGERLSIALGIGFDPGNWTLAWTQRALPLKLPLTVAAVVGIPLASLVVVELRRGRGASPSLGARPASRASWPWIAVLIAGLAAHGWLLHLEQRSEALLDAEPTRMRAAAARMNPWHRALVAEIPRHHARLRARLGPGAVAGGR